jgi:hypothetical protein
MIYRIHFYLQDSAIYSEEETDLNPNPPGDGHIVLTVIWCQIAQHIIKYKKIEKNT